MSKHEDIINYIRSLEVGAKISVRNVATALKVSEGTAYRAIKESENMGMVSSIPRVGTIRIAKLEKMNRDSLTYAEVVNIVDGTIISGRAGIHKTLNKFFIGAMTTNSMDRYLAPKSLMIVGDREDVQKLALLNDAAVLITGGFICTDEIKKIANEKELPIISSKYDTFTIASLINKAMEENLVKKEIIFVEDIMTKKYEYLNTKSTISDWKQKIAITKQERYPVVDNNFKVVGVLTYKDLPLDADGAMLISNIMTKEPITVTPKTTVAYAAHIMSWEDIEICPVVENKKLLGIVTRKNVIKAMQYAYAHQQFTENIEDTIIKKFDYRVTDNGINLSGIVLPEMLDSMGTASYSSLNVIISAAGMITLKVRNNYNPFIDNMSTYFMKPVQIDSTIDIYTKIIDLSRSYCKVEVEILNSRREYVAKSIMSVKILRK